MAHVACQSHYVSGLRVQGIRSLRNYQYFADVYSSLSYAIHEVDVQGI